MADRSFWAALADPFGLTDVDALFERGTNAINFARDDGMPYESSKAFYDQMQVAHAGGDAEKLWQLIEVVEAYSIGKKGQATVDGREEYFHENPPPPPKPLIPKWGWWVIGGVGGTAALLTLVWLTGSALLPGARVIGEMRR